MNSNNPLISVILPVYKEPISMFTDAYNSIMNQTYSNLEIIIIVDNPEYKEAIDFFKSAASLNKNTSIHINSKNLGLINSLNKGLEIANGEFIARMDSDDISAVDRFEQQLHFLKDNDFDLVGGEAEKIDLEGNSLGIWRMPFKKSSIYKLTQYHTPALHPTWLAKKDALIEVGGYRDIKHVEDHDLLARLLLNGFSIGNLPRVVIKYRINPMSVSNTNSQWAYWGRTFVGKHFVKGSLEKISSNDFEGFIKRKIEGEGEDPRAYYQRLIGSLKSFKLLSSFKMIYKLIKQLPAVLFRIKNKIIIKFIFLTDSKN